MTHMSVCDVLHCFWLALHNLLLMFASLSEEDWKVMNLNPRLQTFQLFSLNRVNRSICASQQLCFKNFTGMFKITFFLFPFGCSAVAVIKPSHRLDHVKRFRGLSHNYECTDWTSMFSHRCCPLKDSSQEAVWGVWRRAPGSGPTSRIPAVGCDTRSAAVRPPPLRPGPLHSPGTGPCPRPSPGQNTSARRTGDEQGHLDPQNTEWPPPTRSGHGLERWGKKVCYKWSFFFPYNLNPCQIKLF